MGMGLNCSAYMCARHEHSRGNSFATEGSSYLIPLLRTAISKITSDEASAPATDQGRMNSGAHIWYCSEEPPNHTGAQYRQ